LRSGATVFLALFTFLSAAPAQLRGVPVENIDRGANACTDFDAYANGQWRATHPMPAIQVAWAIRTVTQDETLARLRSIAEEDASKSASLPKSSPGQMTGDFYAACMDESHVNALGLKPLGHSGRASTAFRMRRR
jgi:putative endopeptidase